MKKSDFNLQVNIRSGYIDNEKPEELLTHQINRSIDEDEEEEILLPLGITLEDD